MTNKANTTNTTTKFFEAWEKQLRQHSVYSSNTLQVSSGANTANMFSIPYTVSGSTRIAELEAALADAKMVIGALLARAGEQEILILESELDTSDILLEETDDGIVVHALPDFLQIGEIEQPNATMSGVEYTFAGVDASVFDEASKTFLTSEPPTVTKKKRGKAENTVLHWDASGVFEVT